MTKSVDWAVNKIDPGQTAKEGHATSKKGRGAGKGDKPRHSIRKWDEGWEYYEKNRRKK